MSARDTAILRAALAKVGEGAAFREALRALKEAVEEAIPAGRVFVLGTTADGPVLGSLVSGVGIVDGVAGVQVVRMVGGRCVHLGRFG